ncbi:hypothetical protein V8E54_009648 [Elaphomyces granulatus]
MTNYCSNEEKLIDAITFRNAHRDVSMFGVNDSTLRHLANGRQSRSTRPPTNRKLSDAQDKALVNYIMQLYNIGVPFPQKHIAAAAESVLLDAIPSWTRLGSNRGATTSPPAVTPAFTVAR